WGSSRCRKPVSSLTRTRPCKQHPRRRERERRTHGPPKEQTGHRAPGRRRIACFLEVRPTGRARRPPAWEASMSISKQSELDQPEAVAGTGTIMRRGLTGRGIALAGATPAGAGAAFTSAGAEPLPVDPWSLAIGSPIPAYETPSKYEKHVVRTLTNPSH